MTVYVKVLSKFSISGAIVIIMHLGTPTKTLKVTLASASDGTKERNKEELILIYASHQTQKYQ